MTKRPFALAFALVLATVAGAHAEEVRVRSGNHPGFARLALEFREPAEWTLSRTEEGYVVSVPRPDTFNTTRVFDLIPRTRISRVESPAPGKLNIELACECHATAFVAGRAALVIDIADGPAPADSLFEAAAADPEATGESAVSQPQDLLADAAPARALLDLAPGRGALPLGSALLLNSARSIVDTPRADTGRPAPHEDGSSGGSEPFSVGLEDPAPSAAMGPADAPTLPILPEPGRQPFRSSLGQMTPSPDPELLGFTPATRVDELRDALVRQVGRAVAQGLIEPERSLGPSNSSPGTHGSGGATAAPAAPTSGEPTPRQFRLSTSVDRRTGEDDASPATDANGQACMDVENFDLASWGDPAEERPDFAISRASLLAEFDRPVPQNVLAMARYYLFHGFGVEARTAMQSFGLDPKVYPALNAISLIVDGDTDRLDWDLSSQLECDTVVALWAILSVEEIPRGTDYSSRTILEAFAGLPVSLRRSLGPQLASRFLAAGDTQTADSLYRAISRIAVEKSEEIEHLEVRMKQSVGETQAAEAQLSEIASEDGRLAPVAVSELIESMLREGRIPEDRTIASAAALAFEHRDSALGTRLKRAEILARARTEDFTTAFDEFAKARTVHTFDAPTEGAIASRLLRDASQKASDATFIGIALKHYPRFAALALDKDASLAVSARLLALGLPTQALSISEAWGSDETARRQSAQALLVAGDAAGAVERLTGLSDVESLEIRAQALSASGRHSEASAVYRDLGDAQRAGAEAWRAGELQAVAEAEDGRYREVAGLALSETPSTEGSELSLAKDRGLVDRVAESRLLIEKALGTN